MELNVRHLTFFPVIGNRSPMIFWVEVLSPGALRGWGAFRGMEGVCTQGTKVSVTARLPGLCSSLEVSFFFSLSSLIFQLYLTFNMILYEFQLYSTVVRQCFNLHGDPLIILVPTWHPAVIAHSLSAPWAARVGNAVCSVIKRGAPYR